jgi:hypothetical protein
VTTFTVLDLTNEPRLRDAQLAAAKSSVTAEELVDAPKDIHYRNTRQIAIIFFKIQ